MGKLLSVIQAVVPTTCHPPWKRTISSGSPGRGPAGSPAPPGCRHDIWCVPTRVTARGGGVSRGVGSGRQEWGKGGGKLRQAQVGCEGRARGRWQLGRKLDFSASRGSCDLRCAMQSALPPPPFSNTQAPSSSRQRLPRRDGELGASDLLHKDWRHRASPEQSRELPLLPSFCRLCHLEHEMRAEQAQAGLRRPCVGRRNLASLRLGTAEPPSGQKGALEGEHLTWAPKSRMRPNQGC